MMGSEFVMKAWVDPKLYQVFRLVAVQSCGRYFWVVLLS